MAQHEYFCCYLEGGKQNGAPCDREAEWQLWATNSHPAEVTEACTAHVGELLSDAPEHRVWPLKAV